MKYYSIYTGPWNGRTFDQYTWSIAVGTRKEAAEYTGLSTGAIAKSLYKNRPVYNLSRHETYWIVRTERSL